MAKKDTSPRLGRGLAALLGDQAPHLARTTRVQTSTQQQTSLPIDLMEPSPFQPRLDMNPERLEELADSIRSRGVLQPLLVRPDPTSPDRYQIIAGERRWRAAQLAGLHNVPVHIRPLDDTDAMAAALVENLQRADLNPIEEAEGFQRLVTDYTLTQEELAGAVGKSRPHITNIMRLLNLPKEVRDYVRRGELTAGHARALLTHSDPITSAKIVIEKGLNVRQTESMSSNNSLENPSQKKKKDTEILQLENDLTLQIGLKVNILYNKNKKSGSIKIDYKSLEQFESFIRKIKQD